MSEFPKRLMHGTGVPMDLEATRLLVATKERFDPAELSARLKQARVVLEDAADDADGRRMERINHTDTRFWIRAADGGPLDEGRIGLLREVLGDLLAWVGPVYRLGGQVPAQGRRALVAPLPHVVLVRFRRGVEGPIGRAMAAAVRGLKVTEDRERSKYLNGLRYLVIENPTEVNAYRLRDLLLEGQRDQIADVRLESMPMVVPTAAIPNDTLWAQQWDMVQIDAPAGWDITTGAASVVVCVLDEGCDLTHPDLVFAGTGINLGSMSGDGSPTGPHGTACAGIVAATFNNAAGVAGVAGAAQILPVAFSAWTDVEVAAGITFATLNGADVISMSFGWDAWDPMIIDPAIQAADTAGVVMAVATHNHNSTITYPATNPRVIAVGASDQVDDRKSPTSPDGETWGSNFGPEISVVAPGVLVPTTDIQGADGYNVDGSGGFWAGVNYPSFGDAAGDYVTVFDGTSAATPHVAGLAALLLSQYPALGNADVRRVIERTADKTGTTAYAETAGHDSGTWNQNMGYGRINVRKALDHADLMIRDWPGDVGTEPSAPTGGNFWNFADIVVRITNDDVFVPSDPTQSQYLEIGQTNYLYVRVRNVGPREARNVTVDARLTPFVGTQFVYPTDWTAVDGTHLAPTPITAAFATIAAGGEEIAKFSISAAQVAVLHSNAWHPCVVASVTADNDYAFASAAFVSNPVVTRINNLAQRNLSLINVLADTAAAFPFLAGHALNTDRFLELVINRTALPRAASLLLALDRDNVWFPHVDVDAHVPIGGDGDHDGCGGGLVFLDRTRVRTRFGCCEGVLTLEKGSRFDCASKRRVRDVVVTGGDLVVRDGQRYALLTDDVAVVRLEKAPGQLLPLQFEARLPRGVEAGRQLEVSVAQRDESRQVVGGASVLFVTG
jgi:subtilisin family serine protease